MPFTCDAAGCHTTDLILNIWIAPDGHVIVHDEVAFELAIASGRLAPAQAQYAEHQVRRLTAAIARGRFPPPLVRNWQLDRTRIAPQVMRPY
jgi:predicted RNA-binding protein associated with RNAse of E/G family